MKNVWVIWAALILLCQATAFAKPPPPPLRLVILDTNAPVVLERAEAAGLSRGGGPVDVTETCVNFRNLDPRTAKRVHLRFAYYDKTGKHIGDDTFERRGKFGTGVSINGVESIPIPEGCETIHFPREAIAVNFVYIDAIDFDDGTSWVAKPVNLPDQIGPAATPTPEPSVTPAPIETDSPTSGG